MSDKIKLLIVDDEIQFLESIAKRLELRGFEVSKASSGTVALEIAKTELFDLAILDLKMPGMDGQELLKILKSAHKYLEVIILTGHGSFASAVECTKLGAFGYLPKPYELDKLIDVLKQAYEARLKKKFVDDRVRLTQIAEATNRLAPEAIMKKMREQLAEQPTALSVLRALRKLDDDQK